MMDPSDATSLLKEQQNSSSPHLQADAVISAWRKYAHLYTPLITSAFVIRYAPGLAQSLGLEMNELILFIAATGIPTYLIGSAVYPKDRPGPTPDQSVRFTRKNSLYRAAVIATYGRIFGTPFNIVTYVADVVLSYAAGWFVGERPAGTEQRRSEFLVAFAWVVASHFLTKIIPFHVPVLGFLTATIDRTLYRTAYLALVDDVIGVLTRPNVATFWGKLNLVFVQAFTIVAISYWVIFWIKRRRQAETANPFLDPSGSEAHS